MQVAFKLAAAGSAIALRLPTPP